MTPLDPDLVPLPPAPPSQPILDAFAHHQWVLLGALVIGAAVALVKHGWVGGWLQKKLPPRYIPFMAPLLGVLGMVSAGVIAGRPWQRALIDGLAAGILAVFGHQAVIEAARGGKEIVPEKLPASPWPPAPPGPPPPPDATEPDVVHGRAA